ncbi:MAG: SMC family ATPase [Conexivisphaerales archaeon]
MIEKIILKDFLSHENTELTLEDGINVFLGNNGAGKSSVIDAITYALYGKHTRDRDRNLVRRGASGSAVGLAFTYGHNRYSVERVMGSGGKLERAVLKQLAPVERPLIAGERKQYDESLNQRVAALLRLDYEKMRVAAIIQQGELDSIIQYKPSRFKELMDSLIGIDRFGKAYEEMREPIDKFREKLRAECMGKYDDQNYRQLLDDIEQIESQIAQGKGDLELTESQLRAAREKLEGLKAKISELEPIKLKKDELRMQREQLEGYVSKLLKEMNRKMEELKADIPMAENKLKEFRLINEALAELDAVEQREREAADALASLKSDIKSAENHKVEISRIDDEIKSEMDELKRNKSKLQNLQAEVQELSCADVSQFPENLDQTIEELENKRYELSDQVTRAEEKVKNYEEIMKSGKCPTCDSDVKTTGIELRLPDAKSELNSKRAELESVEKLYLEKKEQLRQLNENRLKFEKREADLRMIADYESRIKQNEERMNLYGVRKAELEEIVSRLPSLETEREKMERELKEIRKSKSSAHEKYTNARQAGSWLEAKGINSQETVDFMKAELAKIEKTVKNANDRSDIRNMAVDEVSEKFVKRVLELEEETGKFDEAEYIRLTRERDEAENKVKDIDGMAKHIRIKIDELSEEKEKLEAVRVTIEVAKNYIAIYEKIRNEIFNRDGSLATSLRSWAIRELSFYASDYVRSFGIGISEVKLSEKKRDVSIECYSGNGMTDIKSLSGGESVAIALALRFAMAKLMGMGMIDFIILDEPTVYLDEERKRSLVNIISGFNAGAQGMKQMVIITHDKEIFENSTVDAMFQFEKLNGITRVEKI